VDEAVAGAVGGAAARRDRTARTHYQLIVVLVAALVYLPGIDGSGQLLLGTAPLLEERFRLLRLRYRLSANAEHRSYAHLASSAIETVALRGVERMILLAESFGGAVALRAAIDFPDSIAAVALVNTFPHFRSRVRLSLSRLGIGLAPNWLIAAGRRILAPSLLFGGPQEQIAIDEFLGRRRGAAAAAPKRRPSSAFALDEGYPARLRMIQSLDLRSELGRVRQPVAIYASERDRIVDAVRQAREMATLLPDNELEILDGRGHVVLPVRDLDWPTRLERLAKRAGVA
jgi:pimeloyl-ACP methyl ester carboxylesterase